MHELGLKECVDRTLDKKKGKVQEMFTNPITVQFQAGTPRDLLYATEFIPAKTGA